MKYFYFASLASCLTSQACFALPSQTQKEAQRLTDNLNKAALLKGRKSTNPRPSSSSAPKQFNSQCRTLSNGLQVIVIEDSSLPRVSFGVLYHVGSADDPENMAGISHMTEHMFFVGGSTKYPDAMKAFHSIGCCSNAWTSYDHTVYISEGPSSALGKLMEIEADRMQNYHLRNKAIFKSENGAVFQERLMSRENPPLGLAEEYIQASLCPQHPYGKPVIGYRHHIQAYTLDAINKHIQTWYKPNNATLIIIGQVKAEKVFALAQQHFGKIAKGNIPPRNRPKNSIREGITSTLEYTTDKVASPKVQFLYHNPHSSTHDLSKVLAFDIGFEALLGNPVFSFCKYFAKRGYTVVLADNEVNSRDPYEAVITFQLPAGKSADSFQKLFFQRLRKVLQQGISREEFERAKRGIRNGCYKQTDDHRQMRLSLVFQLNHLDISRIEQLPQMFESITLEQTMDALREFLLKKPFAVVRFLPNPDKRPETKRN